jgi:hypothetical protein
MKVFILLVIFIVLSVVVQQFTDAQTLEVNYAYSLGAESFAAAISHNGQDNIYVTGQASYDVKINSSTTLVATTAAAFLTKYKTSDGQLEWATLISSSSPKTTSGISVCSTTDAVYVSGQTAGDMFGKTISTTATTDGFLAKYSADGNLLWGLLLGITYSGSANSIAVSSDGVFVVGTHVKSFTIGTVTLASDGVNSNAFIIKFSLTGTALWGYSIGTKDADQEVASGVAVGTDGSVVVTGALKATLTIGTQTLTNAGGADIFIIKYSGTGVFQWIKGGAGGTGGGTVDDSGTSVVVDSSNNVYVSGNSKSATLFAKTSTAGTYGSFLLKFSSAGVLQWATRMKNTNENRSYGVTVSSKGSIFMTGYFTGSLVFGTNTVTSAGAQDMYIAEYSSVNGDEVWIYAGGGTKYEIMAGIASPSSSYEVYATGYATSTLGTFGNYRSARLGGTDSYNAFIIKYKVLEDCSNSTYKNSDICTKDPVCLSSGQCSCKTGYAGSYCNMNRQCNNVLFNSKSVCSGNGTCIDQNVCSCNSLYTGTWCQNAPCHNISASNPLVCSGKYWI